MGVYLYFGCRTCKQYIHLGKTGRIYFEQTDEFIKKFLDAHTYHDVVLIHDAVAPNDWNPNDKEANRCCALYSEVMNWKEVV